MSQAHATSANLAPTKRVQYTLVGVKDGQPATMTHQDDEETPLVAGSLSGLINWLGDWCDCGTDYVLKNLKGDIFVDKSNSGEQYRIIREEVEELPLTAEDNKEIEELRKKDAEERAEFRRKYGLPDDGEHDDLSAEDHDFDEGGD
jgi:hypothetical protein